MGWDERRERVEMHEHFRAMAEADGLVVWLWQHASWPEKPKCAEGRAWGYGVSLAEARECVAGRLVLTGWGDGGGRFAACGRWALWEWVLGGMFDVGDPRKARVLGPDDRVQRILVWDRRVNGDGGWREPCSCCDCDNWPEDIDERLHTALGIRRDW
jgi:hypothetical protein